MSDEIEQPDAPDRWSKLQDENAQLRRALTFATFRQACLVGPKARIRELFDAAPWLAEGVNRDCKITGCLNVTWGDLEMLARPNGETVNAVSEEPK